MWKGATVAVVMPALNEERSIACVLAEMPDWVDDVVVADNGSTDATARVAKRWGARVVHEPRRGYGSACLAGIAALGSGCLGLPDIVVFLDADYSDRPEEMALLVDPVASGQADMVIGSRVLGERERGALGLHVMVGNRLACLLMRRLWGARYTDLGPFRAIRRTTLEALGVRDPDFGWTVEMQIKAAAQGVRSMEMPVSYRKRVGRSKISGTVTGVVRAGTKILWTVLRYGVARRTQNAERRT